MDERKFQIRIEVKSGGWHWSVWDIALKKPVMYFQGTEQTASLAWAKGHQCWEGLSNHDASQDAA